MKKAIKKTKNIFNSASKTLVDAATSSGMYVLVCVSLWDPMGRGESSSINSSQILFGENNERIVCLWFHPRPRIYGSTPA